jgi:hypothetical protein
MQVLDLDVICPDEKILTLGGKKFDITIVPARISFNIYEMIPMIERLEKGEMSEEDYDKFFNVMFRVLSHADKSITKEWLESKLNLQRFEQVVTFIFGAIFGTSKKNGEGEDSLKSI